MAQTKLRDAFERGDAELFARALANGGRIDAVDSHGCQLIHHAALKGSSAWVQLLITSRASVDAPGDRGQPIHAAAGGGVQSVISLLLHLAADVDASDKCGMRPLHVAAINARTAAAETLLSCRARIDARNADGGQPVHLAAHNGNGQMLSLLRNHGASVNARFHEGNQPIHVATLAGHQEAAVLLLEMSAKVDAKGSEGLQPIHLAAREGHVSMLSILLDLSANHDACADNGVTPLKLGMANGRVLHQQYQSILYGLREAIDYQSKALAEIERGMDVLASEYLVCAARRCEELGLHRRAAGFAAAASECEFRLDRFHDCAKLCQWAFKAKPPLPNQPVVKARLRDALGRLREAQISPSTAAGHVALEDSQVEGNTNINETSPANKSTKTSFKEVRKKEEHDQVLELQQTMTPSEIEATGIVRDSVEEVSNIRGALADCDGISRETPGLNEEGLVAAGGALGTRVAEYEPLAMKLQTQGLELQSLRQHCQFLEQRCQELTHERDAMSELAEQRLRDLEVHRKHISVLADLYPHLGASVESIGRILTESGTNV